MTVRDRPVHDNLLEACLVFGLRKLRLAKEKDCVFPVRQGGLLHFYLRIFSPEIPSLSISIFLLNIFHLLFLSSI